MKFLGFLFIFLLSVNSFAELKILSVHNASNDVVLNGEYAPVIMAGIAGRNFCTFETETLNSCAISDSRGSCNFRTVCETTELKINLTAETAGNMILADSSDSMIYNFGAYTPGQAFTGVVRWSEICRSVTGMGNCSFPARTALKIGIQKNSKLVEYKTFILQISGMENNYDDNASLSNQFDGIASFSLLPGDQKAFLDEVTIVDDFMIGDAGKIVGFRAFFTPGNCMAPMAVRNSSDSYFLMLDDDKNVIDNKILDLENGEKYLVMLGLQDEAGNIGYFTDLNASCVEGQQTVTPLN